MGKMFEVEIIETGKHFLKGRQLSKSVAVRPAVPAPMKKGEVSGVFERIQSVSITPYNCFNCYVDTFISYSVLLGQNKYQVICLL